jgi:hypothetical protein
MLLCDSMILINAAPSELMKLLQAFEDTEEHTWTYTFEGVRHMTDFHGSTKISHCMFRATMSLSESTDSRFTIPMPTESKTWERVPGNGMFCTMLPEGLHAGAATSHGYVQVCEELLLFASDRLHAIFVLDDDPYAAIAICANGDTIVLLTDQINVRPFQKILDFTFVNSYLQTDLMNTYSMYTSPYGQASYAASVWDCASELGEKDNGKGRPPNLAFVENVWKVVYKGEGPWTQLLCGATIQTADMVQTLGNKKNEDLFTITDTETKGPGLFAVKPIASRHRIMSFPFHLLAKGSEQDLENGDEQQWHNVYDWGYGSTTDAIIRKYLIVVLEPNYPARFVNNYKVCFCFLSSICLCCQ